MVDTLAHEKQILEYLKTIDHLKRQNQHQALFCAEIQKLEEKVENLKRKIYSELSAWDRVQISRHPQRPHANDYIQKMTNGFQELSGDRLFAEDKAVIGGLASIGGIRCVVIGQEKGSDTESRIERNFGMVSPEGFRKALRLMRLAEKFDLPIVTFLDTPGAYPGLEAEERGQGWAIAENLRAMSQLKVPIVVVIIGEGCSGGALGMGVGDVVAMLEHSYYSVISPEGSASILWKDAKKKVEAAGALKLNAEDLLELGVIDDIIPEPLGGAHKDPEKMVLQVKNYIVEKLQMLKQIPHDILIEQRYQKFRKMGKWAA
jgi:acetyl-CoA carboxylase carboxyl transferase subunit alpha